MEGISLDVSAALLVFGLGLTALGTMMIILSFKPQGTREDNIQKGFGVILIGFLPVVFSFGKKHAVKALIAFGLLGLLAMLILANPSLIGW